MSFVWWGSAIATESNRTEDLEGNKRRGEGGARLFHHTDRCSRCSSPLECEELAWGMGRKCMCMLAESTYRKSGGKTAVCPHTWLNVMSSSGISAAGSVSGPT